ncbi:hypothetical protein Poly51_63650 [Rubripirellula tenax]|uniref:Uncharacterized protein n=1 Tax=Rubripirellula tenax TaxID=2528015 RepID=A0A5C6DYM1_9BACT|nr:hypothetical protein Poly51_63650 [Rubripirellula tenax]
MDSSLPFELPNRVPLPAWPSVYNAPLPSTPSPVMVSISLLIRTPGFNSSVAPSKTIDPFDASVPTAKEPLLPMACESFAVIRVPLSTNVKPS